MAGILNGVWSESHSIDPSTEDQFRNWITLDGSAGPTGRSGFAAAANRYHLYLAHGCPYSHRVLIALHYLLLDEDISISFVDDIKRHSGWQIIENKDPIFGADSLHSVMIMAEGNLTAKSAVPLLVDKKTRRIVSNSSADIVRMMDNLLAEKRSKENLLWPAELSDDIDELKSWIDISISSPIYNALFDTDAAAQKSHVETVNLAFTTLDSRLDHARFLHGHWITASDVWFFTTLLRFDSIYSELFGLNFKIKDFNNIGPYLRDLWSFSAFSCNSDLDRIEDHYYRSVLHGPAGIVEPGKGKTPVASMRYDLSQPSGRSRNG